jgi:hypothetical protein
MNSQSNSSFGNLAPLFGWMIVPSMSVGAEGQLRWRWRAKESLPNAATLLLPSGSPQTKCPQPFPLPLRFGSHLYPLSSCSPGLAKMGASLGAVLVEEEEVEGRKVDEEREVR